jgi:prepilin-type N-terminal cleavage/methylation domain-containing protein
MKAQDGFTLMEVIVALLVGSMLIVGARTLLIQMGETADRMQARAMRETAAANAERLLRWTVLQLDGRKPLTGTSSVATFRSWCDMPAGWQEPCEITLTFVGAGEARTLIMQQGPGRTLPVREGVVGGRLIYLHDAGHGGIWLPEWRLRLTHPLALGLVAGGDTLIIRIGARG